MKSLGFRSIPEVKLAQVRRVLGRVSAWRYLALLTVFFFFYYTFDSLWQFHITCFVLSSQRKNQIVDTIGTLLHHILGEFYRRMPCCLSTVFVTYFLEIREEA